MSESEERRVLLVVTGGIAVYKSLELLRELRRAGDAVQVVMTRAAEEFVRPLSFAALSGREVATRLLPGCTDGDIDHIALGRWAQVVCVAPATADFLARLHGGRSEDLASAVLLALPKATPVVFAPAMNREMWTHPATRRNVAEMQGWDGVDYRFLEPDDRELACGEIGPGALPDPLSIAAVLREVRPA